MIKGFWVWVGVSAFAAEFLLWLAFLSLVPLSLAVLVGSIDSLSPMGRSCSRSSPSSGKPTIVGRPSSSI